MSKLKECTNKLIADPKTWLVTGVAGFIGSNLLEYLLMNNQRVIGLDNFATGYSKNLSDVERVVGSRFKSHFSFIEGDITDSECCKKACVNVDYVLHQAALGSVPRSIEDPIATTNTNVLGFVNILDAAIIDSEWANCVLGKLVFIPIVNHDSLTGLVIIFLFVRISIIPINSDFCQRKLIINILIFEIIFTRIIYLRNVRSVVSAPFRNAPETFFDSVHVALGYRD